MNKNKDINIDVSSIILIYFSFLSISNLLVSLLISPFSETPVFYLSYIAAVSILLYFYKGLSDFSWSFSEYYYFCIFIRVFSFFCLIAIIVMFFIQNPSNLIDFRTTNHHSLGILWLLINLFLLLSPLGNRSKSLVYFFVFFTGVVLTGSRLFLLIYILINMSIFKINLKSLKSFLVFISTLSISAVLAIFREGGKIDYNTFMFFIWELLDRNVALNNGLQLMKTTCIPNLEAGNPLLLIIPRLIYEDKMLVFNVRAFMCYFNKTEIPSKSSGFFLSEFFITYGYILAPLLILVSCFIYGSILKWLFNKLPNTLKLLVIPLLFISVFGPIDGLYSSSFQICILILGIGFFYVISPKKNIFNTA
ncbi:hypothetical protein WNY97_14790 [Pseudoalteromonas fuliginea]|uniref:hypothetical protein n=1 Tax=Pseudoalteromonas fuliginea TaxID=1872678 RepID=UPI00316E9646